MAIVRAMKRLARQNPQYGYRRIYALMRRDGWNVNRKRIQRLWREEGLTVPQRSRKRQRVGYEEGQSVRLRAESPNECWCYDFIFDQTEDGRALKVLTILDEFTRECLAIKVGRGLKSEGVVQALEDLFLTRGDNGPEFVAKAVKSWLQALGVDTIYIEPGSPWENPFAESFHSRLRDEVLNRESLANLLEARVILGDFHGRYNDERPHSSLGYRTPTEARLAATPRPVPACAA